MKGISLRSATVEAVLVTAELYAELYAPMITSTPTSSIRRSASDWPISALPWVSETLSTSLPPSSPGMPASAAKGISSSGCSLLMISAASSMASTSSWPMVATLPLSG